jgi:PAS domain S-box-containing protein
MKEQKVDTNCNGVLSELKKSEERFKALIERAPDAFFAHDLSGRFIQVNDKACEWTGYSRDELLGMAVRDIQRGIDPEQTEIFWHRIMQGETILTEDVLMRKDSSSFPVEITATLFNSEDAPYIFGFVRDITDRKRAEEEKELLIVQLQTALDEVKKLSGLIPICSGCHKIRDDRGYWNQLEIYIQDHSEALFSHSLCPSCENELYKDDDWYQRLQAKKLQEGTEDS